MNIRRLLAYSLQRLLLYFLAIPRFLSICLLMVYVPIFTLLPFFSININQSKSLPDHVYLISKWGTFKKGDLIAYRWPGGVNYPAGSIFIKRIMGVPGDTVTRQGAVFWVNNQYIGRAKPKSTLGIALEPAKAGVIEEDTYFVATPHPDSLDSRYAITGNVQKAQVIGKAYAIF